MVSCIIVPKEVSWNLPPKALTDIILFQPFWHVCFRQSLFFENCEELHSGQPLSLVACTPFHREFSSGKIQCNQLPHKMPSTHAENRRKKVNTLPSTLPHMRLFHRTPIICARKRETIHNLIGHNIWGIRLPSSDRKRQNIKTFRCNKCLLILIHVYMESKIPTMMR